jgi:UDP-glucose 4-epimerase
MTILITGVTGLVGSRLLPRLLASGHRCRVLLRTGRSAPTGVEGIVGDLFEPASLVSAVQGVSVIIHLAAVFRTREDALIWKSNLDGACNLIAAAANNAPDARFVLASTSNVYGRNQARPGQEDDAVDPPEAYPASKVAAERALRESGLKWTILRLPFVYGDGDGHLAALPDHVAAAGWHPALRMSTIHHRDVATAMELALAGATDGRVVNLGDDCPASMLELAALAGARLAGSTQPLDEPWAMQVDTTLARRLGFRPTVRTVYQAHDEGLL